MPIDPGELDRLRRVMAGLDPAGPPRACFVRRPPRDLAVSGGRLGVLDASFNPMTLAHARMVEEAQRVCGLDGVLLMLSRANVDKEVFGADLGQRLAMLVHQTEGDPETSVAGCSHARFVDKARALRPLYPAGALPYFILGYDTLLRLFDPKYYTDMEADLNRLFAACHIVAANRGESGPEEMRSTMSRPGCRPFADRVHFIHLPEPYASISSTAVRERRMRGEPILDLVPSKVAEAIEALGLYR